MLVSKTFEVSLPIRRPIDFCSSYDKHVEKQVRHEYEGRCYKGCYVTKITKIDRVSDCEIDTSNLETSGRINVQFTATVVIYSQWDIVVGIKIVERGKFLIGRLEKDDENGPVVFTVLNVSGPADTVAVGQTVALRIHTIWYPPMQSTMSAIGVMLTRDCSSPEYRLSNAGKIRRSDIAPFVEAVQSELDKRAEIQADKGRKERLLFFEDLLAPAPGTGIGTEMSGDSATWAGPKSGKPSDPESVTVNIINFLSEYFSRPDAEQSVMLEGIWYRDLSIARSSPLVSKKPIGSADSLRKSLEIVGTPTTTFGLFLHNIYTFLKATRQLVEKFDENAIESHENIWQAMRMVRVNK